MEITSALHHENMYASLYGSRRGKILLDRLIPHSGALFLPRFIIVPLNKQCVTVIPYLGRDHIDIRQRSV